MILKKTGRLFILLQICTVYCLDAANTETLDSLFLEWAPGDQLKPGVAVAVIDNSELIYEKAFGYENLKSQTPLSAKSIFDLCSISKQFTGFAIARLVVDRQLSLDDPVKQYLPELNKLSEDLQIRHLLYHLSGLKELEPEFTMGGHGGMYSDEIALKLLQKANQTSRLGKKYDYTNTNFLVLAIVVERVGGLPFRDWCKTNIFQPLGMDDTFINYHPCEHVLHQAGSYYGEGNEFDSRENYGISMIGASSVYSNLQDMVKWTKALQNETTFPEVFKLMKTEGTNDNGQPIKYGFGLGLIVNPMGLRVVNHMGSSRAGFRTLMAIFPEKRFSFVVLSNWGDLDPDRFSSDIIQYCLSKNP